MAPIYFPAKTRVFWDVLDFPVPENRNLDSFYSKVKHALRIEGYVGDLSIHAYGAADANMDDFYRFKVELEHRADEKHVRLNRMLADMIYWAYDNRLDEQPKEETNFLVVAKDIPEKDTSFFDVLATLMARDYNVSLVVPDGFPPEQVPPHSTAEFVWHWTTLFDGGHPIDDLRSDSDSEEGSSHGAEKCQNTDDGSSHGAEKRQHTDDGSSHGALKRDSASEEGTSHDEDAM
ncbi:unnamed protein product [Arabidopsis halleri]